MRLFTLTALLTAMPGIALAYVGPGAGVTLLGALWGLIAGVVIALGVILFWPIRLMLRKRRARIEAAKSREHGNEGQQQPAHGAADTQH